MGFIKNKVGINIYDTNSFLYLKESAEIANFILNQLVNNCTEGTTSKDLNQLALESCSKFKVKPAFLGYKNYPAAVCVSYNEKIVHGIPDEYKFKNGDVVSIDFGVIYKQHYSDNARTIIIGSIENEHNELVKITKDAFEHGLNKAYPGNTTGDIGFAIHKEILKYRSDQKDIHHGTKYKLYFKFQGHGIGMELHENPSVPNIGYQGKGFNLLPGMCICIEPVVLYSTTNPIQVGITDKIFEIQSDDKKPSSHHENQIFITDNGPLILSHSDNLYK